MMEGGVNPKKMARSKRASSLRSKSKHSKHQERGARGTAAGSRARTLAEDSLSSNWERYVDQSGSDEDLPPLAEGEVRPKSKGADYRELLSSDVPQLFEEPPVVEGMTAMLLANGLGLWDWDSSYLEPMSLSSERHAAREASALLSVDLRLLGKSLARLNVAQRLLLEDELFPDQYRVKDGMEMMGIEDAPAPLNDGRAVEQGDLPQDTTVTSGTAQVNAEAPSSLLAIVESSFSSHGLNYRGERLTSIDADSSRLGVTGAKSPSVNTDNLVTNSAPNVSSVREQNIETPGQMGLESSKGVSESKRFEAGAAEAELDDLLDLLDNQVAGISLKKDNQVNLPRNVISENRTFSLSHPASSKPSNYGFEESKLETALREVTPASVPGATSKYTGPPLAHSAKQLEKNDSSSDSKAADATLSLDDDFDSWLDSI